MNISSFWIYPVGDLDITNKLIVDSIYVLEPAADRVDLSRNNCPDHSWKEHLQELETEEEGGGMYIITGRDVVVPRSKIADAPSCYVDKDFPLSVDLAGSQSRRQIRVIEEIEALDTSARRDFRANNCKLTFGYHDIYQHGTDIRKPKFIARPPVSVCLWDYGFVKTEVFKEHLCRLPTVATLKNDLEKLWGTVDWAVTTLSG